MKDVGGRIARQRLLRFRPPEPEGRRWLRWIALGLAVWVVWALVASDHSVARLLRLKGERDRLARQLEVARQELERAEQALPDDRLSREEAERFLRERHNYAREGELIYVMGEDSTAHLE